MPESRSPGTGEDPLLDLLSAAMAPADCAPPEATVLALRRAVASMTPAPTRRHALAGWRGHRWAVVGALAASVTVGTGTAFAAGVPVPPPIRVLATDIGLPVTPQPVVDVENATSALQIQLRSVPPDPARTALAAGDLSTLVHQLDPSQRSQVGPTATQVLQQACRAVFPTTQSSHTGVGGWSGCPATAPAGSPSAGPTSSRTTSSTVPGGAAGATSHGHTGGRNPSASPTTHPAGGPPTTWTRPGTRTGTPTTSRPGPGGGSGSGTGTGTDQGHGSSGRPGYRPPGQDPIGGWNPGGPDQPHQQSSPVPARSIVAPVSSPRTTPGRHSPGRP